MWSGIITRLGETFIRLVLVPLFSKIIFDIVEHYQEKKAKEQRDEKVDKAVEEFKNAKSNEEKEAAFLSLVRHRSQ
jgi:hypothetical protein